MDLIIYLIIFFVGSTLVFILLVYIKAPSLVLDALSSYDAIIVLINMIEPTFYWYLIDFFTFRLDWLFGIMFWAGFAPSIWMWL